MQKRGSGAEVYTVELSQRKSDLRKKQKPKSKHITAKILAYIRNQLLIEQWSPELISQKRQREVWGFCKTTNYMFLLSGGARKVTRKYIIKTQSNY